MNGWGAAPYWIAVALAAVAVVAFALGVRQRGKKRSTPRRASPSSSAVDPFYLDSSHAGEPQTQDGPR